MRQKLSNFKVGFFKALGRPRWISILDALREGELPVNEISQKFPVEPANASQQLAVLRNKNIVVARKEGVNVYHSAPDRTIFKLLDVARDIFNNHLAGVRNIVEEIRLDQPESAALAARRFWPADQARFLERTCKHSQARSFLRPMSFVSTVIREEALIERLRAQQPCAGLSA